MRFTRTLSTSKGALHIEQAKHCALAAMSNPGGKIELDAISHRLPVIVIVGTTGCGKSRLAIDLALQLGGNGGEVVNADVIQMYAGLDIASAKVCAKDRSGVVHHLMSFLQPRDVFTVRDFRAVATAAIADIHARGRVPIVTGGTLYYIQSLLSPSGTLQTEEDAAQEVGGGSSGNAAGQEPLHAFPTLWHRLQSVDLVMSTRLHPNDTRKITRALDVYDKTGQPYSALLHAQAQRLQAARVSASSSPSTSSALDFLVLWARCGDRPGPALDVRLDDRVRVMAHAGLVGEMRRLKAYLETGTSSCSDDLSGIVPLSISDDIPSELTLRVVRDYSTSSRREFQAPPQASGVQPTSTTDPAGRGSGQVSDSSNAGLLQAIGYKEFAAYLSLQQCSRGERESSAEVEEKDLVIRAVEDALQAPGGSGDGPKFKHTHVGGEIGWQEPHSHAELVAGFRALIDATHHYARKQDRWIRNRFASRGVRMLAVDTDLRPVRPPILTADAVQTLVGETERAGKKRGRTRPASPPTPALEAPWGSISPLPQPARTQVPSQWDQRVAAPAVGVVRSWLATGVTGIAAWDDRPGNPPRFTVAQADPSHSVAPSQSNDLGRILAWEQHVCEPCGGRVLNGAQAWAEHCAGKAHAKAVGKEKAVERAQAAKQAAASKTLRQDPLR